MKHQGKNLLSWAAERDRAALYRAETAETALLGTTKTECRRSPRCGEGRKHHGSLARAGTCLVSRVEGMHLPGQRRGKDPGPKNLNQHGFFLEGMKE